MSKNTGKHYSEEFKKEAVKLLLELGSTKEASEKLGVSKSTLILWKRKYEGVGDIVRPTREDPMEELKALRKEVKDLKDTNRILKIATAFFSQDQLKKGMK